MKNKRTLNSLIKELNLGAELQNLLFSKLNPCADCSRCFQLDVMKLPAAGVSGDYFHFWRHPEGRGLHIILSDASGHGIRAALLAAELSGIMKTLLSNNLRDTDKLATEIQKIIYDDLVITSSILSFIIMDWSIDNMGFKITNAGHPYPLIYRHKSNTIETLKYSEPIIGLKKKYIYSSKKISLSLGDIIVVFSDGIVEQKSGDERYGIDRIKDIIMKSSGKSVQEIRKELEKDFIRFCGSKLPKDDSTAIIIKVNRRPEDDKCCSYEEEISK